MTDVKLDIDFWNYDRTQALSDGKVRIPGVDAKYHSGSNVTEIFRGMVAEHRFAVSELGLTARGLSGESSAGLGFGLD